LPLGQHLELRKLKFANQTNQELGRMLLGFGQDNAGEAYLLTTDGTANSGKVLKIVKQ
jgi:hypothetical protein